MKRNYCISSPWCLILIKFFAISALIDIDMCFIYVCDEIWEQSSMHSAIIKHLSPNTVQVVRQLWRIKWWCVQGFPQNPKKYLTLNSFLVFTSIKTSGYNLYLCSYAANIWSFIQTLFAGRFLEKNLRWNKMSVMHNKILFQSARRNKITRKERMTRPWHWNR